MRNSSVFARLLLVTIATAYCYAFSPSIVGTTKITSSRIGLDNKNNNYNAQTILGRNQLLTIHKMAAGDGKGNRKKKRRRRKKKPTDSTATGADFDSAGISTGGDNAPPPSIDELRSIATFTPSTKDIQPVSDVDDGANVELPDIRDVLKRKEIKKMEEDEAEKQKQSRPKISRKDKKAFLQLLEEQPFADADDSYFEDEEYGTVSALLAEGAKDFLGIPPGPLQVGHFIGSLGIILCAFVEYPGFPLTNLPTPLRDALQGGLATVYLINTVLAVLAFIQAGQKGQDSVLWAAKTFSVGGLAFDQLNQLPNVKGDGNSRR